MSKEFWVKLTEWDQSAALAAIEAGAQYLWPPVGSAQMAKKLGRISLVGEEGNHDFEFVEVLSDSDVSRAVQMAGSGRTVVVACPDWKLIPWENLVDRGRVLALVKTPEQAEQALGALERGLFGVVLESMNPEDIGTVAGLLSRAQPVLQLLPARVTSVTPTGMGDRACVDVAGIFNHGEGLLLGDRAVGLFLVAAETSENAFVAPRPFRVNAGGVHHYVLIPGCKTAYLTEVAGGRTVLSTDASGQSRTFVVGRVKIERRPLIRVVAQSQGIEASLTVQNAETVNLVTKAGELVSVAALQPGEEVMIYVTEQARHLGRQVDEWIIER
jgi:3-dehydroquinate synthase II